MAITSGISPRQGQSRVAINGKYLASKHRSGVFRVADQLTRRMDHHLSKAATPPDWTMVCPPDAIDIPAFSALRTRIAGPLTWQVWEQFQLPVAARGQLLVSLANLAPIAHPNAITMVHDAQVFISPQSYSKAFVAWYKFVLPRIGARAAKILTVSDYSRRQLVEYGVAAYDRIAVLHNGADHVLDVAPQRAIVRDLGLKPSSYVVAFSSTQAHKNLSVLFEAFRRPELAEAPLVLVGGTGVDEYAAAGMSPPDNVVYAGKIDDGRLRGLIEAAAALAFPSRTEGFGLPPLEAMTLGCPVVCAPCGALPEVCADAAIYAGPDAPDEWATALRNFVDSASLRQTYQALGVQNASRFRWSDSAERLIGLIEQHR